MMLRNVLVLLVIVGLTTGQNSTDDLEVRVTLLEDDVADLQDELEEVETVNTLQDQRFDNVEDDVAGNSDDVATLIGDVNDLGVTSLLHEERIADLESLSILIQERLGVVETAVSDLETTDESTNERVTDLESTSNDTIGRVTDLEVHIIGVETVLNATVAGVIGLQEGLSAVEGDVSTLQDDYVTLEDRLDELEDTVSEPWEACSSSSCENAATCLDVNVDTFVCVCRSGFFGVTCENSYSDTTFLATFDTSSVTVTNPIVFNNALINTGGNYNDATGIYVTPMDGTYEFLIHIEYAMFLSSTYLVVDNVQVTDTQQASAFAVTTVDLVIVLNLTEGQQVWVECTPTTIRGVTTGGMQSWFSGHLISPL